MNSSMVYCQCDFCGKVPPQMSAITDSLVTQLKLTTTLPHLSANSFADAPFATPMQTDKARETTELNASWKPQHQRQQEKLNFGIETILYGSSKSDLLNTRPNVTFTTPLSVTRQTHSPSWSRPVFSDHQRKTLEDRFQRQHYLNKRERYYLSLYLGLTEHQIKVWFQNRRVKWRHSQEGKKDRNTKLHRAKKTAEKN